MVNVRIDHHQAEVVALRRCEGRVPRRFELPDDAPELRVRRIWQRAHGAGVRVRDDHAGPERDLLRPDQDRPVLVGTHEVSIPAEPLVGSVMLHGAAVA